MEPLASGQRGWGGPGRSQLDTQHRLHQESQAPALVPAQPQAYWCPETFLALCVSSTGRTAQLISEERGSLRLRLPRTDKRRLRVDQGRHGTQFREDTPPPTHTPEPFSRNGSQSELLLQQEGQESDVRQSCEAAPPFSSRAHRKNKGILSPRNRSAIWAVPTVQGAAPSLVLPLSTLDQSRPCHSAPGQSRGGSGRDRRGPCSRAPATQSRAEPGRGRHGAGSLPF